MDLASKIAPKLDAIIGAGKWSISNGIITVRGELSQEQRNKLALVATYMGEDVELHEEPVPVTEFDDEIKRQHGSAIATGLDVMVSQRVKGLARYGVAIEDAGLSADALCEHAQQEMADGLVYTSQLRQAIQHDIADAIDTFAAQLFEIVDNESKSQEMRLAVIREMLLACNTKRCITMYAQQSQLEEFNRTEGNLLQLSRVQDAFVFKTPLKVTL